MIRHPWNVRMPEAAISSLPWEKINDFFLEIGDAKSRDEFCLRVLDSVQRLVPYDVGGGFFCTRTTLFLAGRGLSRSADEAYNQYFHRRHPWMTPEGIARAAARWRVCWKDYASSEYVTDFARPNGLVYSICPWSNGDEVGLSLHRSGWARQFSDNERAILAVVNPHVSHAYSVYSQLAEARSRMLPTTEEIADRFDRLSAREAQILSLLVEGRSAPEVAARLAVGVRTVESHLQGIYTKLDVHSRREAINQVMRATRDGNEPETGLQVAGRDLPVPHSSVRIDWARG